MKLIQLLTAMVAVSALTACCYRPCPRPCSAPLAPSYCMPACAPAPYAQPAQPVKRMYEAPVEK